PWERAFCLFFGPRGREPKSCGVLPLSWWAGSRRARFSRSRYCRYFTPSGVIASSFVPSERALRSRPSWAPSRRGPSGNDRPCSGGSSSSAAFASGQRSKSRGRDRTPRVRRLYSNQVVHGERWFDNFSAAIVRRFLGNSHGHVQETVAS